MRFRAVSRTAVGLAASGRRCGGLFALAWVSPHSLAGEAAATALSGLACVTLGWLLVCGVPARWLRLGVYAMAVIDTVYVSSDLLQGPNAVLNAAAPAAGLPRLQAVHFGSALMGFGDLFVAALVGCLLAAEGQWRGDGRAGGRLGDERSSVASLWPRLWWRYWRSASTCSSSPSTSCPRPCRSPSRSP